MTRAGEPTVEPDAAALAARFDLATIIDPADGAPAGTAVMLFDGVCNLCNASARAAIKRDRRNRIKFASLQSAAGRRLAAAHGLVEGDLASVVLIKDGRAYRKSEAALRIAKMLDGPAPLLFAFIVLPRGWRDAVYDFIGERRYRWFGKVDVCPFPEADAGSPPAEKYQ